MAPMARPVAIGSWPPIETASSTSSYATELKSTPDPKAMIRPS